MEAAANAGQSRSPGQQTNSSQGKNQEYQQEAIERLIS
jgi:hypothetical protein